jgi:hypothetical protein
MQYWPTAPGTWSSFQIAGANSTYSSPVMQMIDGSPMVVAEGGNHTLVQRWPIGPGNWTSFQIAGAGSTYAAADTADPTLVLGGGLYEARNQAALMNAALTVSSDDDYSGVERITLDERLSNGSLRALTAIDRQCPNWGCEPRTLTWTTSD